MIRKTRLHGFRNESISNASGLGAQTTYMLVFTLFAHVFWSRMLTSAAISTTQFVPMSVLYKMTILTDFWPLRDRETPNQ